MRILFCILLSVLVTSYAHGQRIVNHYLYQFPAHCVIHRSNWLKGVTNIYQLTCNDYVKINPLCVDSSEYNRLPTFAVSFFTPSKLEINAADVLIRDQLPIISPDSGQWVFKKIKISDRYYMGYINKKGDKKILAFFECILRYDGPIPPSVLDYMVPISVNLTTKRIFLVRDSSGSMAYLAED
jgi:hypothetical protein